MARWFRLEYDQSNGKWTLGYAEWYISYRPHFWLSLKDDEWVRLGEDNLRAVLSAQEEQLEVIKSARAVLQRHVDDINQYNAFQEAARSAIQAVQVSSKFPVGFLQSVSFVDINKLVQNTWFNWANKESDSRIHRTYSIDINEYGPEHFQKVLENYDGIIRKIEATITQYKKILNSADFTKTKCDTPPILPQLRPWDYFKKGEYILGWKETHEIQPEGHGLSFSWTPHLDRVAFDGCEDGRIHPTTGFLKERYCVESDIIMSVHEVAYYLQHDNYRRFLIERMRGDNDDNYHKILKVLGNPAVLDSINPRVFE